VNINENKINEVFNLAVYLQFMAYCVPNSNSDKANNLVKLTREFLTNSSKDEIDSKLSEIETLLNQQVQHYTTKFSPKISINEIASNWNALFKNGFDPLNYGITYEWLNKQMDISKLFSYNYIPSHFNIGLSNNAGQGIVEEVFLLQDAFSVLVKANSHFNFLKSYANVLKNKNKTFDKDTHIKISKLKLEICSCSRLTIVSFYSFIECFVNSIGYSYYRTNQMNLTEKEISILEKGEEKNRFLSLQAKVEKFPKIICKNKPIKIVTSDKKQMKEPFKTFFETYTLLRDSSVHYAPNEKKVNIWMQPDEWVEKANEFAKLSMETALEFWNACYEDIGKPDYLGRLEFDRLYEEAENKLNIIYQIQNEINNISKG